MIKLEKPAGRESKEKSPTRCTGWKNFWGCLFTCIPLPGPSRKSETARRKVGGGVGAGSSPARGSDLVVGSPQHVASNSEIWPIRPQLELPFPGGWWSIFGHPLLLSQGPSSSFPLLGFVLSLSKTLIFLILRANGGGN